MSRSISDPVFDIGRDLQRVYDEGYKQGRYDEKAEAETSLPSGEQTHALRTETHTVRSDTISRQDAIEALIQEFYSNVDDYISEKQAVHAIEKLPSAQPERKKGKWVPYLPEGLRYKCSECESRYDTPWHFCPNCGSYNGGENHDKG